ncbi:uncharacterized protein LOC129585352 [Paramacrobiotus metropolitanus]|uniref:uncharacterized protein LOC129585352 n=1 Tax=Paramacrobiotus metropolitanus TaxID=2943436 RepID=UPI002445B1CF|nr:uncharacterized protein LOC129585352 [Paramacrobiotus metropolitanus]
MFMQTLFLYTFFAVLINYRHSVAKDLDLPKKPQWSLDPFLGTYEMDADNKNAMNDFASKILGIPTKTLESGERQVFNKTHDGTRYQHFVLRNESKYNAHSTFLLDKKTSVLTDSGATMTFHFAMLNATVLQGSYTFSNGDNVTDFTTKFIFSQDATTLTKIARVLYPEEFQAMAVFHRISKPQSPKSQPAPPVPSGETAEISQTLHTDGETVSHL